MQASPSKADLYLKQDVDSPNYISRPFINNVPEYLLWLLIAPTNKHVPSPLPLHLTLV